MAKALTFRRKRYTASEGLRRADKLEARAEEPGNSDDPKWLKRRANTFRLWSENRRDARVRKIESRRKASRDTSQ
jgi:hypothetical protein